MTSIFCTLSLDICITILLGSQEYPHFTDEETGSERLSDLPEVIQLVCSQSRTKNSALPENECLFLYAIICKTYCLLLVKGEVRMSCTILTFSENVLLYLKFLRMSKVMTS